MVLYNGFQGPLELSNHRGLHYYVQEDPHISLVRICDPQMICIVYCDHMYKFYKKYNLLLPHTNDEEFIHYDVLEREVRSGTRIKTIKELTDDKASLVSSRLSRSMTRGRSWRSTLGESFALELDGARTTPALHARRVFALELDDAGTIVALSK
ncbi:unnamed protein product [Trichogramma brassicae]|uniref:Uncharacterized protein n=1 Tax=Trichogramma brassicae TaxID=86971 RepID=A0A6H5IX16_9HYME|nr:unnamed protein product [Trichogramma brassicae]